MATCFSSKRRDNVWTDNLHVTFFQCFVAQNYVECMCNLLLSQRRAQSKFRIMLIFISLNLLWLSDCCLTIRLTCPKLYDRISQEWQNVSVQCSNISLPLSSECNIIAAISLRDKHLHKSWFKFIVSSPTMISMSEIKKLFLLSQTDLFLRFLFTRHVSVCSSIFIRVSVSELTR